jgi:hypothetical protein
MKLERNPYFKPEEAVLYCGDAVYSRLQQRGEPETPKGYCRTWVLLVKRKGANTAQYIKLNKGRAVLNHHRKYATVFLSYKEAEEISFQLLDRGNMASVSIIETLTYDFVEEDYAP